MYPVMNHIRVIGCALAMVAALAATPASQSGSPSKPWTAPRTPDGQPDIQGVWTNATITPFERPANLADKAFLSPQEAADLERRTLERRAQAENAPRPAKATDPGAYNDFWMDSGTKVLPGGQTSLVVDPADGRVPVRPAAERIRDENLKRSFNDPEFMSVWDRCISRGVPGSMFPAGYNNAYQIFQMPGYVIILYEMIHDARIIPLSPRPHAPSPIRNWMGDSRARWEGDTLVVDVTNYHNRGWIASSAAGGRIKGIPHTERLHVVERFKRTGPDTLQYEATIDDPDIYTQTWKVAFPLTHDPDYRIFEYACHEGNQAVANVLKGARYQEGDRP
jgi:hypothetical protein